MKIFFCFLWLIFQCAVPSHTDCTYILDPPTLTRNGYDYLSHPMNAVSKLTDCIEFCCADESCQAFAFYDTYPNSTCLGGECCKPGSVCCFLKNFAPYPDTNKVGLFVTSGKLSLAGPTPPFQPSTLISGVQLGKISWSPVSGDTWPTTWAEDGIIYGWRCDASINQTFSPMSTWSLSGDPYSGRITPNLVAATPIDYMTLCSQYGKPSASSLNVKPGTVIALNDTVYTSISCMNYGDDPQFNRQHNLGGFLSRSDDHGKTWRNVTEVGSFSGKFSAPIFVSCGQNNDPCRKLFSGFLYVFFIGGFDNNCYWCNNDAVYLARVQEMNIEKLDSYEYFTGLDINGSPRWNSDSRMSQPVMVFSLMIGENAISYNPYINRFIMANYGFIDNRGQPRPWHQNPYMAPHRTQLIILEAQNAWGPWTIFHREDDAASAPGLYTPTFPSAYMLPPVGKKVDMIMFFSCLGQPENCRYTLNWQPVTLELQ